MALATVADGTVTAVSRGPFNCYVLHDGGSGSPVVVDPGLPSNGTDACAIVQALYGTVTTTTTVCTHGHSDHLAGLDAMRREGPVDFHLPVPCKAWLGDKPDPSGREQVPGLRQMVKIAPVIASQPLSLSALREFAPFAARIGLQHNGLHLPFDPAGFLADGDSVPGTEGWEVLATPGHTSDSTCFYHPATATLLSGDTVLTHDGQAWLNPEHLLAEDSATTEERLRQIPVEHLLPGHGLPISGSDLLGTARSYREPPTGRSLSCMLSRRLGDWSQGTGQAGRT